MSSDTRPQGHTQRYTHTQYSHILTHYKQSLHPEGHRLMMLPVLFPHKGNLLTLMLYHLNPCLHALSAHCYINHIPYVMTGHLLTCTQAPCHQGLVKVAVGIQPCIHYTCQLMAQLIVGQAVWADALLHELLHLLTTPQRTIKHALRLLLLLVSSLLLWLQGRCKDRKLQDATTVTVGTCPFLLLLLLVVKGRGWLRYSCTSFTAVLAGCS